MKVGFAVCVFVFMFASFFMERSAFSFETKDDVVAEAVKNFMIAQELDKLENAQRFAKEAESSVNAVAASQEDLEKVREENIQLVSNVSEVAPQRQDDGIPLSEAGEGDERDTQENVVIEREEPNPFSQTEDTDDFSEQKFVKGEMGLKAGYRMDYLRWNIAGNINGQNPDVLSELTWEDLQIFLLKGHGQLLFGGLVRVESMMDYGWINDGKNQDSDYNGNGRTLEYSRSNNETDNDDVMDLSFGAGLQFPIKSPINEELGADHLQLALLSGYSYHEQNLRITNGFQSIPANGPFGGLNSTYQTRWDGPWVGMELYGEKDKMRGLARVEYHWFDYYAHADWNLRTDLAHPKSYEHETDGKGISVLLDGGYQLSRNWTFDLNADIKVWNAGPGIDRTFASSGATAETRLNEVEWLSYAVTGGLTYHFPN